MTWFTDLVSLIRLLAVQRTAVFLRENSNCLGSELYSRAKGTDGDFATVCNQDFLEHMTPSNAASIGS